MSSVLLFGTISIKLLFYDESDIRRPIIKTRESYELIDEFWPGTDVAEN